MTFITALCNHVSYRLIVGWFGLYLWFLAPVYASSSRDSFPEETGSSDWVVEQIINAGFEYLGKPYRYKVDGSRALDCSGFICHIYGSQDIHLSGSSSHIASSLTPVSWDNIAKGDLLFFKGRNLQSNQIGHVGIVVSKEGDKVSMLHSCRRGIVIDEIPDSYYSSERFVMAGRLPDWASDTGKHIDSIVDSVSQSLHVPADSVGSAKLLRIMAVGDIMLGTHFPSSRYLPPHDGAHLLDEVQPVLKTGDVVFGNLEGVLLTERATPKKCKDTLNCYAFKSPEHYINHFKAAGFNLLSVANNHVGDFGDFGRTNTIRVLQEAGIHFAGLTSHPYTLFSQDSITYGFCAFAPNYGTVSIHDYEQAKQLVAHLDSLCDVVIVSFHGGAEGAKYDAITRETEMFLGENRGNPYEFARVVIDAGADLVLGHGPHVPRAVDLYKGRFIAYSLGNFATYARFNLSGNNGLAPLLQIHVKPDGSFVSAQIHSAIQKGEGGPQWDPHNKAAIQIKKLTQRDIPEAPLLITNEGLITPR